MHMRSKIYRALSRAKYAAIGAAIGGGIGGLMNKNAASTGAAMGALAGAIIGEKRVTVTSFVDEFKERKGELSPLETNP